MTCSGTRELLSKAGKGDRFAGGLHVSHVSSLMTSATLSSHGLKREMFHVQDNNDILDNQIGHDERCVSFARCFSSSKENLRLC
jgi:hypothetical protein